MILIRVTSLNPSSRRETKIYLPSNLTADIARGDLNI
jgi:hypothetical protein